VLGGKNIRNCPTEKSGNSRPQRDLVEFFKIGELREKRIEMILFKGIDHRRKAYGSVESSEYFLFRERK
jgi:hypothetical protein